MALPKHIAVIRLSALGDVAMTVPVLRAFINQYPLIKVTVVSKKFFEPLFKDLPNVTFLEADVYGKHKGLLGLLKLSREIKCLHVDTVLDLHQVIRSKIICNYLSVLGVKSVSIDKGRKHKKALTNAQGKSLQWLPSMHERYANVFRSLGINLTLDSPTFPPKKELCQQVQTLIGKPLKKRIGIAPFAAFKSKMYPLSLMSEVLEGIVQKESYQVFLFGGGKDEVQQLENLASSYEYCINVAGKLSFEDELALISNLDLMVSMDSGNGHLAAAYGIPVITLWGVTHPAIGFVPFNQPEENQILSDREKYPKIPTSVYGNKHPQGYEQVMKTISAEKVIETIHERLH